MSKKNRNRILSLFVLLFFISSQGLFLFHPHNENENKNTCEHSGSDNHIHNKHTDKCEICQHNFHSPISLFKVKTLHFYRNDFQKHYSNINHLILASKNKFNSRGPPVLDIQI